MLTQKFSEARYNSKEPRVSGIVLGEEDLISTPKGVPWKVETAKRLGKETTARNPWIAVRLRNGHPNYVSNLVNQ